MKKSKILLIGCLFIINISVAQPLPEVNPTKIGLTSEGVISLDSLMERYTQPDRFPCAMLMVARNGEIGYWKAFGVRDLETKTILDRNDVFRIFSITKPITATAILQLWEKGKLGLDDPVEKYIPSFADIKVLDEKGHRKPIRLMTIRHLLTFSSGTTYGFPELKIKADSILDDARLTEISTSLPDLMDRLSKLPLFGDPGEVVSYGWQTDILGRIIEIASGISLDQYYQKNIFTPLGMNETNFQIPENMIQRFPVLYLLNQQGMLVKDDFSDKNSNYFREFSRRTRLQFLSGGEGLVSTPADYIRFAQMLANKGEFNSKRILKTATVELMTTPNPIKDNGRQSSLQGPGWLPGFQLMIAPDIHATTGGGHNGLYWMSGSANLYFWVDPATNIIAMVWAQLHPYKAYPIFDDARKVVHGAFDDAK